MTALSGKQSPQEVFSRVVAVSPDLKAHGGIASVVGAYMKNFPSMRLVETNSRRGTVAGLFRLAAAFVRLPLLRVGGARIMHVHAAAGKSFVRKKMLIRWGRLFGYRIVFHSHSGLIKPYAEKVGTGAVKKVLDRCDRVAVLSSGWKRYFEDVMGQSDVTVVNNIVEPVPGYQRDYARTGPVRFLFMGLLMERKGVFDLIEAVRILNRTHRGRFEVVVGGAHGEEERFHAAIADPEIAPAIVYAGWLDSDAKEEQLRRCDMILLPSHAEGVPISILEGFAHGMPALASRVGGIPDMMTDGVEGSLVEVGNPGALAAAMQSYIDDPSLLCKRGEAALAAAKAYYPAAVGRQLLEMYAATTGR